MKKNEFSELGSNLLIIRISDTRVRAVPAGRPVVHDRDGIDERRRSDDRSGWKLLELASVVGHRSRGLRMNLRISASSAAKTTWL